MHKLLPSQTRKGVSRHSFIQMSKLSNVKGRISYITSRARQENLYATYRTADNEFWNHLARESQTRRKSQNADKQQRRPPERERVLKRLHQIQAEGRQRNQPRHRKKSVDRDSR